MQFLRCHLNYFPVNCGDFSEEPGEHSHQDTSDMEKCYQGRCNAIFLADALFFHE